VEGSRSIVRSDANKDGVVYEIDVTRIKEIILGIAPVTSGADCKGDGEIDAFDITGIKMIMLEV